MGNLFRESMSVEIIHSRNPLTQHQKVLSKREKYLKSRGKQKMAGIDNNVYSILKRRKGWKGKQRLFKSSKATCVSTGEKKIFILIST